MPSQASKIFRLALFTRGVSLTNGYDLYCCSSANVSRILVTLICVPERKNQFVGKGTFIEFES